MVAVNLDGRSPLGVDASQDNELGMTRALARSMSITNLLLACGLSVLLFGCASTDSSATSADAEKCPKKAVSNPTSCPKLAAGLFNEHGKACAAYYTKCTYPYSGESTDANGCFADGELLCVRTTAGDLVWQASGAATIGK